MDNDIIENATIIPLEELGHEPTDEEIMELFGRVRRSRMRHGHGGPCGQHRPGDAASDPRSAQGRILLPRHLLEYARLEKEALVVGAGNRAEIWNPAAYDEDIGDMSSDEVEAAFMELGF